MQTGADAGTMFDDLKTNLAAPLGGMSISFTSSLFGLSGSLILGFLDLQAGQAQNRFYTELEDALTAHTSAEPIAGRLDGGTDLKAALDKLSAGTDQSHQRASSMAMANLADGIQALVQHMRAEQQQIRDWVESQAEQNGEIKKLLSRLLETESQLMPLGRRARVRQIDYWPGFVDALSTMLLVIIFLLSVFMLAQFFLAREVTGKDTVLTKLNRQIDELTSLLALAKSGKQDAESNLARADRDSGPAPTRTRRGFRG